MALNRPSVGAAGPQWVLDYDANWGAIDSVLMSGGTRYAHLYPGANASAQINAAIADLPAYGGICDATGYGATTQVISSQILVGATNKRVVLKLSPCTLFSVTVTGGVDVFLISDGSSVVVDTIGGPLNFGGKQGIQLASTANISSVFAPADKNAFAIMIVKGVTILGHASATVTQALIDVQALGIGSIFSDITVYVNGPHIGMLVRPGSSSVCSDVVFLNDQVNGAGVTGARPFVIQGGGASQQVAGLYFCGCGFQHAGSGQYELEIDGLNGGSGGVAGCYDLQFYGYHHESRTGSLGIKIRDAQSVQIFGLGVSGSGSGNVFTISESVSGLVIDFEVTASFNSGNATNWIVNSCTNGDTIAISGLIQPAYKFRAPSFNQTLAGVPPVTTTGQVGYGASVGFGNGSSGTAMTTTTKNTGTGPTTPQTITGYLKINVAGNDRWIPYCT